MNRKKKKIIYPNLEFEKVKNGDTYEDLGSIVDNAKSTVLRKMRGKSSWTEEDIEALCEYYKKDYYYLFKKEA